MATTTNYSWSTPDNTGLVKDGALNIRTLGSAIDTTLFTALGGNYPGLRLIKKQTIGTGVSSVAVTDAYSATYSAYKIVIVGGVSSASATDLTIINTGSTSSYAYSLIYLPWGGSIQSITSGSTSNYPFAGHGSSNVLRLNCDVFNPFTATNTQFMANYVSGSVFGTSGCLHSVNTSYTGFTITPASGTLTGGTIYVYGYGAS